jgi:hypothetical protein
MFSSVQSFVLCIEKIFPQKQNSTAGFTVEQYYEQSCGYPG